MGARRERVLGLAGLLLGVVLVAAAIVFAVGGSSPGTHAPGKANTRSGRSVVGDTPFAATSIWNTPLSANAPVAPNSSALVGELERQVGRYGSWINTSSYSTPIYTVPASESRVPVTLDMAPTNTSAARLAKAFRAGVPIPSGARPAPGTDADLVVWQPATDTMWELWNARLVSGEWHARWGGKMGNVSKNPGYFTDPSDWGTAATSLALLGGIMRISELRAGHIDHALGISIPQARRGVVAWPAQRSDGSLDSTQAIPEGTRFRLDPRLDLNKLKLPSVTRMIAEAAQRYGLFVRDQSGAVAFYGEQVTQTGPNPYTGPGGIFGSLNPQQVTAAFPWRYLEVVSAPVHPYQ
jgi:hypothetical protein